MFVRLFTLFAFLVALSGAPQPLIAQEQITVFAAASLRNALDDSNAAFTKATGIKVVSSYEASSALARQIEQGAPADVFISADLRWMDYVAERKLINPDTRVNLLGNKLVLIAPVDSKLGNVTIGQGFDIAKLAGDGRIAVADVKAVPAGLYAKAALEKLAAWQGLTQCFIAALPFLDKTVLGDLFWTAVLFGGAWLMQHVPSLSRRAL